MGVPGTRAIPAVERCVAGVGERLIPRGVEHGRLLRRDARDPGEPKREVAEARLALGARAASARVDQPVELGIRDPLSLTERRERMEERRQVRIDVGARAHRACTLGRQGADTENA